MPSALRRTVMVSAVAGITAIATTVPAGAVTPPRRDLGTAIEAPAPYQPRFLCSPTIKPGVKAFRNLVLKTYKGTASVSEGRSCSAGATSEHMDGRAWDWGVNVTKSRQKKQAAALLKWLLAADQYGNEFAMARRLGVMYVIWNKKMWSAYSGSWKPYPCSGATSCHRDHMHFSFGWAGAQKKTSYWTNDVAAVLPPPIPIFTSTGSAYTVRVPAKQDRVWGAKGLKGGIAYSFKASGTWRRAAGADKVADAACVKGKDGWRRAEGLRSSAVWHWQPTTDTGGGCNTDDHTYVATVVPWVTDAISFSLEDNKRADNSGAVTVRITRVL